MTWEVEQDCTLVGALSTTTSLVSTNPTASTFDLTASPINLIRYDLFVRLQVNIFAQLRARLKKGELVFVYNQAAGGVMLFIELPDGA
jgi:hypothetical protein